MFYFSLTKGDVDERKPVPTLTKNLSGKLLETNSIELILTLRKNKKQVLAAFDTLILRKCRAIETINDQHKISFNLNIRDISY